MAELLPKSKRNYLRPGDRVQMKTGEILTVKSLEFCEFVPVERAEYVAKSGIHTVVDTDEEESE